MLIILKVIVLFAIIIVPLRGPSKRKSKVLKTDRNIAHANYAINEEGNLIELYKSELSRHEH